MCCFVQVVDRGVERGTYRWRGIEHFRGGSELIGLHGAGGERHELLCRFNRPFAGLLQLQI